METVGLEPEVLAHLEKYFAVMLCPNVSGQVCEEVIHMHRCTHTVRHTDTHTQTDTQIHTQTDTQTDTQMSAYTTYPCVPSCPGCDRHNGEAPYPW